MHAMTATEYRAIRRSIGTQADVAKTLGVTTMTVKRREKGPRHIKPEAAMALRDLERRGLSRDAGAAPEPPP